jgi:ADP-ribose pyrophosphatase YjhB (NUDIX family)
MAGAALSNVAASVKGEGRAAVGLKDTIVRMDTESQRSNPFFRIAQKLFLFAARVTRGMTLGVRVVAVDPEGRVFLVRHSYVKGWHLPGGGVDPGETLEEAMRRELREEGNITGGAAVLVGMHLNRRASPRDHVAVYLMRDVRQTAPRQPDREIVESGFFPLDALPEGTTPGTRRRIREALDGAPVSAEW